MVNLTDGKDCLAMEKGRVHLPRGLVPMGFAHLQRYKAGNALVFAGPSTWSPQFFPGSPLSRVAAGAHGKST